MLTIATIMVVFVAVATLGLAGNVRVPLSGLVQTGSHHVTNPNLAVHARQSGREPKQAPLTSADGRLESLQDVPIFNPFQYDVSYFADVSVGSPAQNMTLMVDISAADTFVSSVTCDSCGPNQRYDVSASSSGVREHKGVVNFTTMYYMSVSGNLTHDTFDLAGIEVKKQSFVDTQKLDAQGLQYDNWTIFHGVLGLSPSAEAAASGRPSLFLNMAAQDLLDHNIVSLRLREPARLTLGDADRDAFVGDTTRLPLSNNTPLYPASIGWQTTAQHMTISSTPDSPIDLANMTASFTTSSMWIMLPSEILGILIHELGFRFDGGLFMPAFVYCSQRDYMPDITLNLAGHDFTLTAYDYTIEWPWSPTGEDACATAMSGLPTLEDGRSEIVLGSAFLRKYYSIFDLDSRTIGFAELAE